MKTFLASLLLTFLCYPFLLSAQEPSLAGSWQGKLQLPGGTLPLQLHVSDTSGSWLAQLDSPAQGVFSIPATKVNYIQDSLHIVFGSLPAEYVGRAALQDGQLSGKWRQNGTELPLNFFKTEETQAAPSDTTDSLSKPSFREHKLTFWNATDSIMLEGTLSLPADSSRTAALLISGSGAQDRDQTLFGHTPFRTLAQYLNEHGIAVLRFDDRGFGDSGGNFAEATTKDLARDAGAGIKRLRELGYQTIGLIGHSEGAIQASQLAAADSTLAFVISLAGPALPGDSLLLVQGRKVLQAMNMPPTYIEQQTALQTTLFEIVKEEADDLKAAVRLREAYLQSLTSESKLSPEQEARLEAEIHTMLSPWYRSFLQLDPRKAIRQLSVPVLAIFGSLDVQVPAEENVAALQTLKSRSPALDLEIVVLEGHNHLFQEAVSGLPSEYAQLRDCFSPMLLKTLGHWLSTQLNDFQ